MSKDYSFYFVVVTIFAISAISFFVLDGLSSSGPDSYGYASSPVVGTAKIDLGCYQNIGYNIYKKGFVTYSEDNFSYVTYRDGCIDNETLKEFYCENNVVKSETVKCSYICTNGICKNQTKICVANANVANSCKVCNSAGTAYMLSNARCIVAGQTCNSAGKCVVTSNAAGTLSNGDNPSNNLVDSLTISDNVVGETPSPVLLSNWKASLPQSVNDAPLAILQVSRIASDAPASASALTSDTNYGDVAVIVNDNSAASLDIGNYFASKRGVPSQNIIHISVPDKEEINDTEFSNLRSQVENYLTSHNLQDSINYLVTTKGVPLKVSRTTAVDPYCFSMTSMCASVNSELMLILGPYSSYIGQTGKLSSAYFSSSEHFSRSQQGIYLVTRLDAYTVNQVKSLIDRSGPNTRVDASANFVLDKDPVWDQNAAYINVYLDNANNILSAKGRSVILDSTTGYLKNMNSVIGYASWGSNDHTFTDANPGGPGAIPHNSWVPGSIAETFVSTSGRSFTQPPVYGQSLVADLISEGVTGVKGYAYEPYASAMANVGILFDRYSSGYNLAESYFSASRYMGWMDVVIGDPKTTINFETLPVQLSYFGASANRTYSAYGYKTVVRLEWKTISEKNNYGFYVERRLIVDGSNVYSGFQEISNSFVPGHGTTLQPQSYSFIDENVPGRTYEYRLRQIDLDGTQTYSDAIRINLVVKELKDK